MTSQIANTRYQARAFSPGEAQSAEPVGHDNFDINGSPGADKVHTSPCDAETRGRFDVSVNGSLLQHLTRQQVQHLSLAQCTANPTKAGTPSASVAPRGSAIATSPEPSHELEKKAKGNSTVKSKVLYYEIQFREAFIANTR
jgi:hypothetical protein